MLRVRFHANYDDSRPVNWPVKHPYWESGFAADESYAIVVSYADDLDYIKANWPEASNIEVLEEDATYKFGGRFPKPTWFQHDVLGNGLLKTAVRPRVEPGKPADVSKKPRLESLK